MKGLIPASTTTLLLLLGLTHAQERCDVPSPSIFCNSTSILEYESSSCTTYHIFLTRGSDEPYPGRLGNLTSEICSDLGGTSACSFENVEYPAKSSAWGPDVWCESAGQGAANGQAQMAAYSEQCPDAKLILLGFSQGGAVAQDILGGGGGSVFACQQEENPAMDASVAPGSNVIAAVTFGAVVRSRDQNFTVGRGVDYDGQSPRTSAQLAGLNAYSSVLLDYCHYGDPMCAVGSTPPDTTKHLNYFVEHNDEVKKWVVGMAKADKEETSAKPSKPVISLAAASPSATASGRGAVAASATVTDGTETAKQTSTTGDTGAAGSLTVAMGNIMALAALVIVLL